MRKMFTLLMGAAALMLAFAVLAGCSGNGGNVANAPGNTGNGSTVTEKSDTPSGKTGTDAGTNMNTSTNSNTNLGTNAGTNTNTNTSTNTNTNTGTNTGTATEGAGKPAIVASNEAFRVYEPAPNAVVGKSFKVKGEARVFEAAFSYSLEDGHNVLAEGHVMASMGAPEWGTFEFTVTLTEMPTSPTGVLTIYESSAKDGTPVHKLNIAYTFEKGILKLETE